MLGLRLAGVSPRSTPRAQVMPMMDGFDEKEASVCPNAQTAAKQISINSEIFCTDFLQSGQGH